MAWYASLHGTFYVMQVSIYNFIPSQGMTLIQRVKAASQSLAEGKQVSIIEPYYKIMADGRPGIRIDNPLEVSAVLIPLSNNKL
jgi:hypothetical protein